MIKSATRPPHVSFIPQFGMADVLIILLLAVAGYTGFPGFPKFSDIKTNIGNLEHKAFYAAILLVFDYLLLYRKIRKCYFSIWLAGLHAVLCTIAITAVSWLFMKMLFLPQMGALDLLIAAEAGSAAVFLVVQNWVEFNPDFRSLGKLRKDIDAEARSIVALPPEMITRARVKRLRDLCDKLRGDIQAASLQCPKEAAADLGVVMHAVDEIRDALDGASGDDIRRRLRLALSESR